MRLGQRRDRAAKKGRHRRLEGWSVREPILQREHHQTQLWHRTPLSLQINRLTGWRAPHGGEGTVRLSPKGESDRITQRSAVQIRPPQPF
jgi:hypothetical protein